MKKIGYFLLLLSSVASAQTDSINSLQEVVVTGTRNVVDVRHIPMTVNVINREALEENHTQSVLPAVMKQVPSLFVTSRSMMGYGVSTGASGNINMRGISGGSGQLFVLIDGHPQYNGIYGHPISDSYQTLMAERVEVLRGPASVLYGSNAMGGVINIVTRKPANDGINTSASVSAGSYGTFLADVSNQLRSGRFTSTVSAQYGRTDNHRPHNGFEQYGGYAKFGYDISRSWESYVDIDITHFNSKYPGSVTNLIYGADQWITRGVVSAAVENHYDYTSGAISVYSNFGRHKIDDGSGNPESPSTRFFRSKDSMTGISIYQSTRLFTGNRITLGMDFQHIYGNAYYTSKQTGEVVNTPNKQSGKSHRNEIAVYADFRQELLRWITANAGIRFDRHSVTGTEWIPQMGIVISPINSGDIKLSAGKGFRNPTMREMYLYPPSNEKLEPERIMSYELSWRHRLNNFHYGANLFYINGDNMIQTVERKNVNTGKIENYGLELEADFSFSKSVSINTNHSFLHMNHHVVAAPEYKGYIGANVKVGKWHFIPSIQYVAGLFTSVGDDETKENFCLVDAVVEYRLCNTAMLWVKGENLLAQSYEINKGYPMPHATFMVGVSLNFQ
ncbi:MAG: TonB-dependent receptor plug domain-containing protein [Muribaculaceae bacterium]